MAGFTTPTERSGRLADWGVRHPLFGRIPAEVSMSLLKIDGTFRLLREVADEEIAAATRVYLGGRRYLITSAEVQELTEAGYGDWVYEVGLAYGEGIYGFGLYGWGGI